METFVLKLYSVWFWITRKYRVARYAEAADTLNSAWAHLWGDFVNRASTRDRGSLLPHQIEALSIVERYAALARRTTQRLNSLGECSEFIREELTGAADANLKATVAIRPTAEAAPQMFASHRPRLVARATMPMTSHALDAVETPGKLAGAA